MDHWNLDYTDSNQYALYHTSKPQHRILVAEAADEKDHDWYVLPHVGELGPSDPRYEGPDRETFDSRAEAAAWADAYAIDHPEGLDADSLEDDQFDYDADSGERHPIELSA